MAASSRFGVSLKQLRDLMEFRGAEGVQKLNELGGVKGLLSKLNTSEDIGNFFVHHELSDLTGLTLRRPR